MNLPSYSLKDLLLIMIIMRLRISSLKTVAFLADINAKMLNLMGTIN